MQKTGWTIHIFFLVLSGLKKSFTLDVITRGQSITIFLCIGPFLAWWQTNDRPNNQVILEQACSWPMWEGSLLQLQIPRQIQAHTIVHWTMSILGQPAFSTIIVLVLFWTNCCTGSLTGGLQWPWVWKWTSLQISTFYWIRQLLFTGRNQWSTKSPIHQYKINIQLTSVIYWLELFPPGSSNLGLSPFRWENWHTEIPWKKNIFLTFFRQ